MVIVILGIYSYQLVQKNKEVVELNLEQQTANTEMEKRGEILLHQIAESNEKIKSLDEDLRIRQENLSALTENLEELSANNIKIAEERADRAYQARTEALEAHLSALTTECQDKISSLQQEIEIEEEKLAALKAKQKAFKEEQLRKEQALAEKDFYRLVISESDIEDIQILREAQKRIFRKETIDKVIWENYYKTPYDTLISHLFKGADKVSGIYKITSLNSGKEYIGQSVGIQERFKQHIKSALSCAPSTNKLYQEMKKYGPENFMFEVLEIVPRDKLNEREIYWIEFYDTKNTGLNKTAGNINAVG